MKYLLLVTFLFTQTALANPSEWLICQTPDYAPNIDFGINAVGNTILMTLTSMRGDDSENFRAEVSKNVLENAVKDLTFDLVFSSENGNGSLSASSAIVKMQKGILSLSLNGASFQNIKCNPVGE